MEWYRRVQFVSAVPMPADMAAEFGTTVNGMWAAPDGLSAPEVNEAHTAGRRVLFSVPMIALTPQTYREPDAAHLLNEVCADVEGTMAECGWYYWEPDPVYAACIYSDAFRTYLVERCTDGVDRGMDVVNLDEIMTSIGLMTLSARGCGFCARCLERFRDHLDPGDDLASADDAGMRTAIRDDGALFDRYRRFHEREAFRVMVAFIDDLRSYAASVNPAFAISANVAYLGSYVARFGALWGCLWGPHLDFVMMEGDYRVGQGPHALLPRGTFTASYKLGAALNGAPNWICPSIQVPRQLADEDRQRYYELMFLEAYAAGGRWGYYWWPGVDASTRRRATAPEALKTYIRFIDEHRDLYEGTASTNELAVLYLEGPVLRRPETHEKYLALAQALTEAGYQFDVLFGGDGEFNPDTLDAATLGRYVAILVPDARDLGPVPTAALEAYARDGGELIVFSESSFGPALTRREDGRMLVDFWREYRDEDRDRIAATVHGFPSSVISSSDPAVRVMRGPCDGDQEILHVLNYGYDAATDSIAPAKDVRLSVPWRGDAATCSMLTTEGDRSLATAIDDGVLVVNVPEVDPYAVLVLEPAEGATTS